MSGYAPLAPGDVDGTAVGIPAPAVQSQVQTQAPRPTFTHNQAVRDTATRCSDVWWRVVTSVNSIGNLYSTRHGTNRSHALCPGDPAAGSARRARSPRGSP